MVLWYPTVERPQITIKSKQIQDFGLHVFRCGVWNHASPLTSCLHLPGGTFFKETWKCTVFQSRCRDKVASFPGEDLMSVTCGSFAKVRPKPLVTCHWNLPECWEKMCFVYSTHLVSSKKKACLTQNLSLVAKSGHWDLVMWPTKCNGSWVMTLPSRLWYSCKMNLPKQ